MGSMRESFARSCVSALVRYFEDTITIIRSGVADCGMYDNGGCKVVKSRGRDLMIIVCIIIKIINNDNNNSTLTLNL